MQYTDLVWSPSWICADTKKTSKGNIERERGTLPMSYLLVIWSDIQRIGGENSRCGRPQFKISGPLTLGGGAGYD